MTKTQIQVPDEQMERIREFARRREWTLAETFRRGVEMLLENYGNGEPGKADEWRVPVAERDLGWKHLSDEELKDAVDADREGTSR